MHLANVSHVCSAGSKLAQELAHGIRNSELRLFLQGQVNASGSVPAAEALVRWAHPGLGLLPPASFIPLAEATGLIVELENWVLANACRLLSRHATLERISVNVSPQHILSPGFVSNAQSIVAQHAISPGRLTLEITESLFERPVTEAIDQLTSLAAVGFSLSMDDFGVGYSSLAHLAKLPIHELKLDRSLVRDAPSCERDALVCNAMISLCDKLKLRVVAEGIETEEQAAFFANSCELLQGFHFGYPEPAEKWLCDHGVACQAASLHIA